MNRLDGVLNNGRDFDMSKVCSCNKKISECEKQCTRYYRCDNVAMADDILKEYEEEGNGINENISYGIFVLGYDLLQKKLNKLDFPCDVAYEKCKKIYNSFLSSKEYFLDKSEYECLQDYLEENKELVNAVLLQEKSNMAKYIVDCYETYSRSYEVEASSKEEAEEIVKNDIFEGRREAPYNCINSWCEVEELE